MEDGSAAVDAYFAKLPEASRATMDIIRATIRGLVPEATERIAYDMPAFSYRGKGLAYYGAWKKHCALYGMDTADVEPPPGGDFEIRKGNVLFPNGTTPSEEILALLISRRLKVIRD